MLVHAVEELELEATERVQILEDKLRRSATAALEVRNPVIPNMISSDAVTLDVIFVCGVVFSCPV